MFLLPILAAFNIKKKLFDSTASTTKRNGTFQENSALCNVSSGTNLIFIQKFEIQLKFSLNLVPPMLMIMNQLVGSAIGQKITLECQSEAFPKSINYWMKNETIITRGE